jgi:DNA-3-methyladenine glycosylase
MFDLSLPAEVLAPLLVGALLSDGDVVLRLTEVEAYGGTDDPAAHAWRGPRPHTMDLFAAPGTLYCYRSHGLHTCGNIVCGTPGGGSAILFRAGRVVTGREAVRSRRGSVPERRLASGPGNLGRAMGWGLADSGRTFGVGGLGIEPGKPVGEVVAGPRTGVSVAWTRPWRFWDAADDTVSAYRRSPRIRPEGAVW